MAHVAAPNICHRVLWILTRVMMVAQLGYWGRTHVNYEDVNVFQSWVQIVSTHAFRVSLHGSTRRAVLVFFCQD